MRCIPSQPVNLAAFTVIGKEVDIVGSIIYLDEFPLTIGLLARKAFDVESLISLVLPITRFEEAFDALADRVSTLKVLLHPAQS